MRRREFIKLIASGATAWPLVVRAQQPERMRRIGVLMPFAPDDAEFQTWVGAFLQGLAQSGWIIGQNIKIETRWTKFDPEDTRKYAAELVALAPDVILANGNSTVGPLLRLTRTIPIVFPNAGDPVATGVVELNHHEQRATSELADMDCCIARHRPVVRRQSFLAALAVLPPNDSKKTLFSIKGRALPRKACEAGHPRNGSAFSVAIAAT
jgi:putative ABC transport system substrate-binding protein